MRREYRIEEGNEAKGMKTQKELFSWKTEAAYVLQT
jgi:hypothetical protein